MPAYHRLMNTPLTADRGRWCVPVPWDLVGVIHDHLKLRGCPTTLCAVPAAREAHLVLWPGVDPRRVVELIRALQGERARPVVGMSRAA